MRYIMKHGGLWSVVLIVGAVFIAIPIAAHVGSVSTSFVGESHRGSFRQANPEKEVARASAATNAVVPSLAKPPQDRYDRRRQYWEDRVDRRIERRQQYIDGQVDNGGGKGNKKSAASNDDEEDDEEDDMGGGGSAADDELDRVERRREYWRDRVDRNW